VLQVMQAQRVPMDQPALKVLPVWLALLVHKV
jgi:hypothetical protein